MKKHLINLWIWYKTDNREDWEKASDDFMNKFLKFVCYCIMAYGVYIFIYALFHR